MSQLHWIKTVKKDGFTLIELIIVITLFALITTFMVVNTRFLNRFVVRTELEQLCMVCRYLQSKALATHQKQQLTFNIRNNTYISEGISYQLPGSVTFGILPGIKGSPATPTQVISEPITFKNNQIVFHETGIVSAGTVYLVDMKQKSLYALTAAVSPVSFIRLYHYSGSWQLLK